MPLPQKPFVIHGGCNCKAVRYEVNVPAPSQRPITPYRTPDSDVGNATLPAVYVCHCNDCRAASTAMPLFALITETKTVRASLVKRADLVDQPQGLIAKTIERDWSPALELFDFQNTALDDTFLAFYRASPQRSRWFCSRCGTSLAYNVDTEALAQRDMSPMLDIYLGTVDAKDLKHEYMKPERMLWCDKGLPWVREWARHGAGGIPEHPLTKIDIISKDAGAYVSSS